MSDDETVDQKIIERIATAMARTLERVKRAHGVSARQCATAASVVMVWQAKEAGTPISELPAWLRDFAATLEADPDLSAAHWFNRPPAGNA